MSTVCHCSIFEQDVSDMNKQCHPEWKGTVLGSKWRASPFLTEARAFDWRMFFSLAPVVLMRNPKLKVFVLWEEAILILKNRETSEGRISVAEEAWEVCHSTSGWSRVWMAERIGAIRRWNSSRDLLSWSKSFGDQHRSHYQANDRRGGTGWCLSDLLDRNHLVAILE